ncbi:hypothetical protein FISHEDRAFT_59567 [Fistulina hepatica ATCC 64428]|uniref:Myosin-binding domain-containing protein n=1 Tax=Fistulina hepatica ATCC 64428 TaxID=1128425 RepID=A0A0D7A9U6_9AGAR|nr:hypothetical protein FISHEDRAFT_59567 [Fistulina hepatica ATCC 64428]
MLAFLTALFVGYIVGDHRRATCPHTTVLDIGAQYINTLRASLPIVNDAVTALQLNATYAHRLLLDYGLLSVPPPFLDPEPVPVVRSPETVVEFFLHVRNVLVQLDWKRVPHLRGWNTVFLYAYFAFVFGLIFYIFIEETLSILRSSYLAHGVGDLFDKSPSTSSTDGAVHEDDNRLDIPTDNKESLSGPITTVDITASMTTDNILAVPPRGTDPSRSESLSPSTQLNSCSSTAVDMEDTDHENCKANISRNAQNLKKTVEEVLSMFEALMNTEKHQRLTSILTCLSGICEDASSVLREVSSDSWHEGLCDQMQDASQAIFDYLMKIERNRSGFLLLSVDPRVRDKADVALQMDLATIPSPAVSSPVAPASDPLTPVECYEVAVQSSPAVAEAGIQSASVVTEVQRELSSPVVADLGLVVSAPVSRQLLPNVVTSPIAARYLSTPSLSVTGAVLTVSSSCTPDAVASVEPGMSVSQLSPPPQTSPSTAPVVIGSSIVDVSARIEESTPPLEQIVETNFSDCSGLLPAAPAGEHIVSSGGAFAGNDSTNVQTDVSQSLIAYGSSDFSDIHGVPVASLEDQRSIHDAPLVTPSVDHGNVMAFGLVSPTGVSAAASLHVEHDNAPAFDWNIEKDVSNQSTIPETAPADGMITTVAASCASQGIDVHAASLSASPAKQNGGSTSLEECSVASLWTESGNAFSDDQIVETNISARSKSPTPTTEGIQDVACGGSGDNTPLADGDQMHASPALRSENPAAFDLVDMMRKHLVNGGLQDSMWAPGNRPPTPPPRDTPPEPETPPRKQPRRPRSLNRNGPRGKAVLEPFYWEVPEPTPNESSNGGSSDSHRPSGNNKKKRQGKRNARRSQY